MIRSKISSFPNDSEYLEETSIGDSILLYRKIKSPTKFFYSLLVILSVVLIYTFIDLHVPVLTDLLHPPGIY
ncbi:hypothetical protein ABIC59_004940 [Priestia aryabhattai]|jgi:hypothetical protein